MVENPREMKNSLCSIHEGYAPLMVSGRWVFVIRVSEGAPNVLARQEHQTAHHLSRTDAHEHFDLFARPEMPGGDGRFVRQRTEKIVRAGTGEKSRRRANRFQNVRIASARFSEMQNIRVDRFYFFRDDAPGEGRIHRFKPIEMYRVARMMMDAHQAVASNRADHPTHRMRRDDDAALRVHLRDRFVERLKRTHRPLDAQREQVAFERRDLSASQNLEAIVAPRGEVARLVGAVEHIVVGDRDQIQVGLVFDKFQHLFDASHAVAVSCVNVKIRFTHMQIANCELGIANARKAFRNAPRAIRYSQIF